MSHRAHLSWMLVVGVCLSTVGCTEGPPRPDADGDGAADELDCAPMDPIVHPGALDGCDGVDTDCDGVVDSDPSVVHQPVYEDADGDGWGRLSRVDPNGCVRPGWAATSVSYDCDDDAPHANPEHPELCDVDGDGSLAALDCNDLDAAVRPTASERCNGIDDDCDGLVDDADPDTAQNPSTPRYGVDADLDGHTSLATTPACALPGAGFAFLDGDCDDSDPNVNPSALDECATQADRDCSGSFEPVRGMAREADVWGSGASISELFTRAGPTDEPTVVQVLGDVYVCPGRYRVRLEFGGWSIDAQTASVIGRGASAADVVFDAGGRGRNARVATWSDLDQDGPTRVSLTGVTFTGGESSESGGCLDVQPGPVGVNPPGARVPNVVQLSSVRFASCSAPRGGAVHVANGASWSGVDVQFLDCGATERGGAVWVDGGEFTLEGGGFSSCTAPAGGGSAASIALVESNFASFVQVDFGSVTDDVDISFDGSRTTYDYGAATSVRFDAAHPGGI